MHEFTISDSRNVVTFIRRDDDNTLHCSDKIKLIKMIRDVSNCSLLDAKNFTFSFINQLNALHPDPNKIRSEIKACLDQIEDTDTLFQIMNTIRNNIS